MPLKALDDLSTGRLVDPHDFPVIFGIKLASQASGVHQITEQHGELAAFGGERGGCG